MIGWGDCNIAFSSSSSWIAISNIGKDKSIADDFDFETRDCKQ